MKLGLIESKFADIIWQNEPLSPGTLVKLTEETLAWKKSTTYTVLKKLCDRGIFKNENGIVSSVISKEELQGIQSERFVNENFGGSLSAMLAAFGSRKKLSQEEIDKLHKIINEMKE